MTVTASPDADRALPDLSTTLPAWVVHFLTRLVVFLRAHGPVAGPHRAPLVPSWRPERPDLASGATQVRTAAVRGAFGHAIAWMDRRPGIDPGRSDRPRLLRTITAFGRGMLGFHASLRRRGLSWRKNPEIVPDVIGLAVAMPLPAR